MAENVAGKSETTHLVQIEIREKRSSLTSLTSITSVKESRPPTPMSLAGTRPPTPASEDEKPPTGAGGDRAPIPKGQRPPKKEAPPSGGGRRYAPEPPPDPKQNLHFIAFLTDRTIPEGGKAKISCYVQGPDPQARWYKGMQIVYHANVIHILTFIFIYIQTINHWCSVHAFVLKRVTV